MFSGALLAAVASFSTIGFRHDIAQAIGTMRFDFIFLVTLLLTAGAALLSPLLRPGSNPGYRPWLLLIPAIPLLGVVIVELIVTPSELRRTKLIGRKRTTLPDDYPSLSVLPPVRLFLAMRHTALGSPGEAGAVAALASAGISASLYASNCFDDSPLFVATWYLTATFIVAAAGYSPAAFPALVKTVGVRKIVTVDRSTSPGQRWPSVIRWGQESCRSMR